MKKTHFYIKKYFAIIVIANILLQSCSKEIKPIDLDFPEREINTSSLQAFKSNLNDRNISIGYLSNWGKTDASILMHTPDSLDIIVLTDGFTNLTEQQKQDLADVKNKKATKVFISYLFPIVDIEIPTDETISDSIEAKTYLLTDKFMEENPTSFYWFVLDSISKVVTIEFNEYFKKEVASKYEAGLSDISEMYELMNSGDFDGISLELPTITMNPMYIDTISTIIEKKYTMEVGMGKSKMLIIENPSKAFKGIIDQANWLVYKRSTPNYNFKYFDDQANEWSYKKYIPSVDFANETDADGFADSKNFGADGIIPRTLDIINWEASNKGGVAFYNIQSNYTDINGNVTYSRLKKIIHQLQENK